MNHPTKKQMIANRKVLVLVAALILGIRMAPMAEAADMEKSELCPVVGDTAELIMKARQAGMPMSQLMGLVSESAEGATQRVNSAMVLAAYKVPKYSGAKYQASAAHDLRTEFELMCYQSDRK